MAKKKEFTIISAFKIFFEGIKLYLQNIDKFIYYMSFPVLGQIIGIILIFTTVYLFASHINQIISINPSLDNVSVMFILLILIITPSFTLFIASCWKYLVAIGALNSMANNIISGAKFEDVNIHNDIVTRNLGTFLGLMLILSLLFIVGIIPIFWIILLIIMIYFSLVFQIFALEEGLNVIEIFKKSIQTVKGNFLKVTFVLFLLWLFTYNILPSLIDFAFEKLSLYKYLCIPIEAFCKNLPLAETQTTIQTIMSAINSKIKYEIAIQELSKSIATSLLEIIIIGYTLPLRSICCTILYKNLETKKLKEKKIKEL